MESEMKLNQFFTFLCAACSLFLISCEEEFVPDTDASKQELVLEGYIESGEGANPTYVILTKSIPFVSTVDPNKFSELFVRGAKISVNDGDKNVSLTELCLADLPEELKREVYATLGFDPDSASVNICVYVDLFDQLKREQGRTYALTAEAEGKVLTATTTIPIFTGLYDFEWQDPPGKPNDTLSELNVKISDPAGVKNFYRYYTSSGGGPLIPPFTSVTDDAIFDGKEFQFPLQRAERRDGDFDPETFGLFMRGDTVTVKWACLDKKHFDFWNTRDYSANRGGPFSSYTRIASNVKGGLGIWGGYSVATYRFRVPPK